MSRVGVYITTKAQAGRTSTGVPTGRYFVAGFSERGPVKEPTVIRSTAEFNAVFGGRTAYNNYVYDSLRTFFGEGGSEAVFVRVVGPAGKPGKLTVGETFEFTASSPGAWSENVTVGVEKLEKTQYLPERSRVTVTGPDGSRESFTGATVAEVAGDINQRSRYVTVSVKGDAFPEPAEPAPLSAGDDDRANVTADTYVAGLDMAGDVWGTGAVAVPGIPAEAVGAKLMDHAKQFSRVAFLATDSDAEVEEAEATATQMSQHEAADYAALVYPWVVVPDGSATRITPPEGYAAAKRAQAHAQVGPWRAPAGEFSRSTWVLGTSSLVDTLTNERLVDAKVTGIVTGLDSTRLYGWWSLSKNVEHFEMLSARDTLNSIMHQCREVLEEYVFDTIDGRGLLTGRIESALVGVLDPISRANGVYPRYDNDGNEIDPGYSVIVDDTLNTPQSLAENKVLARVAVRLAPTAKLIELEIVKTPFTGSL